MFNMFKYFSWWYISLVDQMMLFIVLQKIKSKRKKERERRKGKESKGDIERREREAENEERKNEEIVRKKEGK